MRLNKGTLLQNPDFIVFFLHFLQNQVTAQSKNRLALHVSKHRSSVAIYFFFLIMFNTSKIRDVDDADQRNKVFSDTNWQKKMYQRVIIIFCNRFSKSKYLIPIN